MITLRRLALFLAAVAVCWILSTKFGNLNLSPTLQGTVFSLTLILGIILATFEATIPNDFLQKILVAFKFVFFFLLMFTEFLSFSLTGFPYSNMAWIPVTLTAGALAYIIFLKNIFDE